ncbi:MAG: MaoC family dehydratase [Firmicutes bacterium]|nr:MaoC family dehydratase [Bacillota bacterium]
MDYGSKIKKWEDLKVGDSQSFSKTMTETDVIIWVGLTGDMNPMHIDKEYSKGTRFGDVLVPGVLVQGLISTVVTMVALGNVYASQSVKFIKPVFIGDTITATATVIEKVEAKHMIRLETKCVNQKGELVIIGEGMDFILM